MNEIRAQLRDFLLAWFEQNLPGSAFFWYDILVILWIALNAVFLHFLIRSIAKRFLKNKFVAIANQTGKDITAELALKFAKRLSYVLQGAIVIIQARLWFPPEAPILRILEVMTDQWIILFQNSPPVIPDLACKLERLLRLVLMKSHNHKYRQRHL